jgi:hypothetical protein
MNLCRSTLAAFTNHKFNASAFVSLVLVLACFGLSPVTKAVVPAPDGGYPGGNTAEGQNALFSLTTGGYNTATGFFSLRNDMTGSFNTAIGVGALLTNTGDQNTATGVAALLSNNTAAGNTADGAFALFSNTVGTGNTASGLQALFSNVDGIRNTASGVYALNHNVTGGGNTAVGYQALATSTASSNTAVGNDALVADNTGGNNTAIGAGALSNNMVGGFNTAVGAGALSNSTGLGNIGLGATAGGNIMGASNVIAIGHQGVNVSNTTWINNVYGATTISGTTVPVIVSDAGQLGTNSSSQRFKKDINTMAQASETILWLRPVTFHYKSDTKGVPQFGLIAEEVAKVNPDLVVWGRDGKPYSVRYDAVNAMLLNEFLKEHRKNEQQGATITDLKCTVAQQQKQIEALTAGLQKVSAQLVAASPSDGGLELSKAPPQVVNNP